MQDYDPNEIITELRSDGDWDEQNNFFTDATGIVPRLLAGYTASGTLQRRGSADAPLSISTSDYLSMTTSGVTIYMPQATTSKLALAPDIYDFFLVLHNGSKRESVPSWAYEVVDAP